MAPDGCSVEQRESPKSSRIETDDEETGVSSSSR